MVSRDAVQRSGRRAHRGRLTIETRNVDLDDGYAASQVGVTPGLYVLMSVSDNGAGIDPGTVDHIFDPFFTTKGQGKGTGLGLSTVHGIVPQSGGNIWVQSEKGRRTTSEVYLPRVDAPAEQRGAPAPIARAASGTETILLVEDEEMVRHPVRQLLEDHGYTVLWADGATRAPQEAHNHGGGSTCSSPTW